MGKERDMNISEAITDFLDYREGMHVSSETITFYRHHLYDWAHWCEAQNITTISAVTVRTFRGYMNHLKERPLYQNHRYRKPMDVPRSANSLDSAWRALRAFWNFLTKQKVLADEQQSYFCDGRLPRPKVEQSIRPTYPLDLFHKLLAAACSDDPEEHYRDHAILSMLKESGMRNSELCSLTDETVKLERHRAELRGKGGKHRWIYWGDTTAYYLRRYLEFRSGTSGGPLFRGLGSRNQGGAMTPDSIRSLFKRLSKRAQVKLPKNAPVHALRHTFAHDALDAGVDCLHLAQLMGHEDIETTKRYVQENPERLAEIHARIENHHKGQE
jgi:site-specific recombinase XerD